ncbi:MAG: FG-GAP repeat protein [Planctomycetes bacterium]|nr:FG-GAP repeat protein [Planctomycetota bacterium]
MRAPRWVFVPFRLFVPFLVIANLASPLHAQCPLLHTFEGTMQQEYLGAPVSGVGDLDGDGCDDVLIAASGYRAPDGTYAGRVCVRSGATGAVIRCWVGGGAGFGAAAGGAGDVDGDGVLDIIVGANFFSSSVELSGRVYVFSGATGATLWIWDGDKRNGKFGWRVAGPGDLDGDGFSDLLVGQPDSITNVPRVLGQVHAYSGRTGVRIWTRTGDHPGDAFGASLAGAGDFNADGVPDVVVGSPHDPDPTYVQVLSGDTGALLSRIEYWGISDVFGGAVAGVGDINGDGYDDIVVGAYEAGGEYYYSGNGQAYVFCGPDAARLWTWEGETSTSFLGYAVAGPGDVDGDSVPDVVVGAYGYSGYPGYATGKVYVFSGATGATILARTGQGAFEGFGLAVGGVGDADGDGLNDIAVGAPLRPNPNIYTGRAYVFRHLHGVDPDCDGLTTLRDYDAMAECRSAPVPHALSELCRAIDLDGDWDVDLRDFAALLRAFSTP